jgi:hypothetical protein
VLDRRGDTISDKLEMVFLRLSSLMVLHLGGDDFDNENY